MIEQLPNLSLRRLPRAFRDEYILERIKNKNVLSVGLGGQESASRFSFQLSELTKPEKTLSGRIIQHARSASFVDISNVAISRFSEHYPSIDFHYADIMAPSETWPEAMRSQRFDVIVLGEVLEHLHSPGIALLGLKSLLHEDGCFVITVPSAYSMTQFIRMLFGKEHVHPEHVAYYSPSTLYRLAEVTGLYLDDWCWSLGNRLSRKTLLRNPKRVLPRLLAKVYPQFSIGIMAVAQAKT